MTAAPAPLLLGTVIYLDHNATVPLCPEVFAIMRPFLTERWGNPSSSYIFGSKLKAEIEAARRAVAQLANASASEVVFTGSATEADNTALNAAFADDTALVSLMWVNNETGVLFPVADIAARCRARGVPFHCDAVQAAGKLPIDLKATPIDYLALSAHKLGGPKGVGALIVRKGAPFAPTLHGGHQERGRRGGTENVAGIVGFGRAAELARTEVVDYAARVAPLRDRLETELLSRIAGAERNGHATERLANTTSITFPGVEAEALLLLLDQAGSAGDTAAGRLGTAVARHKPRRSALEWRRKSEARDSDFSRCSA